MKRSIAGFLIGFVFAIMFMALPPRRLAPSTAEAFIGTSAKANHISNVRAQLGALINFDANATALINEANDMGFLTAQSNAIVDGDFTGANAGITASDYNTAMTQMINYHNAMSLGVNVGGNSASSMPSGLRAVFSKVAK